MILTSNAGKLDVSASGIPRAYLDLVLSWNLALKIFCRFFDLLRVLLINSFLVLFYLRESQLPSVASNLKTLTDGPVT